MARQWFWQKRGIWKGSSLEGGEMKLAPYPFVWDQKTSHKVSSSVAGAYMPETLSRVFKNLLDK